MTIPKYTNVNSVKRHTVKRRPSKYLFIPGGVLNLFVWYRVRVLPFANDRTPTTQCEFEFVVQLANSGVQNLAEFDRGGGQSHRIKKSNCFWVGAAQQTENHLLVFGLEMVMMVTEMIVIMMLWGSLNFG